MSQFVKKVDNLGNPIMVGLAELVSEVNRDSPQTYNITKEDGSVEERVYYPSSIRVVTPSGGTTDMFASVYPKTLKHLDAQGGPEVGGKYLVTLQRVERRDGSGLMTLARLSHLRTVFAQADE